MSEHDWEEVEQQMRIHKLKREAQELTGGQLQGREADDCPPEILEEFWRHVVDYEKATWTTRWKQLIADGVEMPPPDALDDEQLSLKLWQVIDWLAGRRTFLHNTDHLSDRELYAHLWSESLREEIKDVPLNPNASHHIDMLGTGSEDDVYLNFRYFADEDERRHWIEIFPDYELPDRQEPPYDRDRHLPQPAYEMLADDEEEDDEFDEWKNLEP